MRPTSLTVISRTFKMTKAVKDKNLDTNKVSISKEEKEAILPVDNVFLEVKDKAGNILGGAVYSGVDFHKNLRMRQKITNKHGDKITFWILPYKRNK